ncbi:MAG: mechanosensitive ion channel family protein [Akkermansia sp.]
MANPELQIIKTIETAAAGTKHAAPAQNPETFVDRIYNFFQLPEYVQKKEMDSILQNITIAAIWLIVSSLALLLLCRLLSRLLDRHMTPQAAALLMKIIRIVGWTLITVETFSLLGFDIITVLGAASIIGIAVGFASQTSLSNIISGLFLVGERQINLGDTIDIQGIRGSVDSINLLSVQLRMPDNTLVRIPNEMIIKNPVSNLTRYDTRRCDIELTVDYNTSFDHLLEVLNRLLDENPMCLDDPPPDIFFTGFQESSMAFKIGAWCKTVNFQTFRMDLAKTIKREFDKEHISMPFPIRSVEARSPIKVAIVTDNSSK